MLLLESHRQLDKETHYIRVSCGTILPYIPGVSTSQHVMSLTSNDVVVDGALALSDVPQVCR